MKLPLILSVALLAAVSVCSNSDAAAAAGSETGKLQVIFMLGQGEMVGKAELSGAAYMLSKPLVPPRDITLNAHKAMPHQPNGAFFDAFLRALEVPEARTVRVVDELGSLGAAAVAVAFDRLLRTRPVRDGDLVLFVAVGAGSSRGAALLRVER